MNQRIKASVKYLVQKHGTRDPESIAKGEGINIVYKPYSEGTKGYYININGSKYIVINENLDEYTRQVVLSHELGHAMHHSDHDIYFIREHTFLSTNIYEDEANAFAAELLIDCNDIDEVQLENMSIEQISKYFRVTPELVEYKFKNKK